ncbi:MAG: hypothetical protein ACREMH_11620 [Gemmatimonadales bacterium]
MSLSGEATATSTGLDEVNARLATEGRPIRVGQALLLLAPGAPPNRASVVFSNDRNLRLPFQWVQGDPRRGTTGNQLRHYFFSPLGAVNTFTGPADGEPQVDASFGTWEGLSCVNTDLVKKPFDGTFPSAIFAGGDPLGADINTTGFIPAVFFDLVLGPGASTQVLGVTFPFIWVDENGDPTDIDGDGNADTAFAEIWYNNGFTWTLTGVGGIDVQTVALHENGHGLGLGHFGKVHATFPPPKELGRLHVSPRAVMNMFILSTLRELLGSDKAGVCGIFASWGP